MKKKILLIILTLICLFLILYILYYLNIIPLKKYNNAYFNIKTYYSKIDKDEDGIDDQTDILENAKNYIAKKPIYQSKYYATGYPDDNYGVCTDVIAFALLDAGYDLKELVSKDILANRESYNIPVIDKNIDFRRVNNLKIYFDHHALTLTNDINDLASWQGGDIVVFKNHIGLISDNRNKKGIPFVIHHASKHQKNYEEDILEKSEIIAHYRIS